MKIASLLILSTLFANTTWAAPTIQETALRIVPQGKIVHEKSREFQIQTPKGSVVEVEFTTAGEFEEASGKSIDQDVLNPDGLLSLEAAVTNLKKAGKSPVGEWSLEKKMLNSWQYEFEGFENNKKMEYVINAKTGQVVDTRVDD